MDFNLYLWKLGPFSKISIAQLHWGENSTVYCNMEMRDACRERLIVRVFSGY